MKFYFMKHCGGLDEALKTRKVISKDTFNKYLKFYDFYSFDNRINCIRFMHHDFPNNGDFSDWLLLEYGVNDVIDISNNDIKNTLKEFLVNEK